MRTSSLYSQDDPISAALKPPPSETEAERRVRLSAETEAKRVSDRIDEELRLEREHLKKKKGDVKLLLLGQAESGKSTLQKQFQLMYEPSIIDQERASWKLVIYYNIIHSLKQIFGILDTFDDEDLDSTSPAQQPSPSTSTSFPSSSYKTASSDPKDSRAASSAEIDILKQRLSELIAMYASLAELLTGGVTMAGSGKGGVYVRSGWQARTIENTPKKAKSIHGAEEKKSYEASLDPREDAIVQHVGHLLTAAKNDVNELWGHRTVNDLIKRRKLRLDEWSEFFLNNFSRIAAPNYIPTTDDILHARIQTIGVSEHVFDLNIHGKTVSWHLFDVGGARGQRHTWVPYFDDANAIIFVAPVSAFDQYLEEDPGTNRIDDSLQLFTQICSNALLKSVHLVLFLNKTDLLKTKLESGLKVRKYITSFADRSNDYETVMQYFRAHFLQVHRRNNENRRVLYTHFTSAVDTKTTQRVIGNVRDSIFRGYLQSAALV